MARKLHCTRGTFKSYNVSFVSGNLKEALEKLKIRQDNWQAKTKVKTDLEKKFQKDASEKLKIERLLQKQNDLCLELAKELKTKKDELDQECAKRKEIFGDKNPTQEEAKLKTAADNAVGAEKKAQNEKNLADKSLEKGKTALDTTKALLAGQEAKLSSLEAELKEALRAQGFPDEQTFLMARLSEKDKISLENRSKLLDKKETELLAKEKDCQAKLAKAKEEDLTKLSFEEATMAFRTKDERRKQINQALGQIAQKLSENIKAKDKLAKHKLILEQQAKETARWGKLAAYIGSANGQRYRAFAQGLTFEFLLKIANRKLEGMHDRYLLCRVEDSPLELNVIDNYQAALRRSTKNLSGGETFLVSLALALGLAQMASQNVRLDSLFLDEGFGTLDEDALETALETLANLRQDGKMIGIISHVAELKERIPTQIEITPIRGGVSKIEGPGCTML